MPRPRIVARCAHSNLDSRAAVASGVTDARPAEDDSLAALGRMRPVVSLLLSVTFACGLFIAVAHVLNHRFIAPVYDVVANLTAFGCAVAASLLLGHPIPATLSAAAIMCWLALARRTILDRRRQD